jgi:hypothetical protein
MLPAILTNRPFRRNVAIPIEIEREAQNEKSRRETGDTIPAGIIETTLSCLKCYFWR